MHGLAAPLAGSQQHLILVSRITGERWSHVARDPSMLDNLCDYYSIMMLPGLDLNLMLPRSHWGVLVGRLLHGLSHGAYLG